MTLKSTISNNSSGQLMLEYTPSKKCNYLLMFFGIAHDYYADKAQVAAFGDLLLEHHITNYGKDYPNWLIVSGSTSVKISETITCYMNGSSCTRANHIYCYIFTDE